MLKNIPLGKINGAKNTLFFLSRAPTYHSFTFNLQFFYELKHKVRLSKTLCGIFHFRFRNSRIGKCSLTLEHKIELFNLSFLVGNAKSVLILGLES